MGNSPYDCFIGTKVWYRDGNGDYKSGIVKNVINDTFVIRTKTSRFGRDTVNINIRDVFETKESLMAQEYKEWKHTTKECMEKVDSPEKILRSLYQLALSEYPMTDEMRFAVRIQTKNFFGIELDEEAAARARELEEIVGKE